MKFFKKLLKKRKYSLKNKFYLEAAYLNETDFKQGAGLSYHIDNVKKELTVVVTDKATRNHVSSVTQTRTKKVVPTIDIRKSDVREFLANVGELELSVYQDKLVLSVMVDEKEQLREEFLRDENNNIIELASYKDSKAKFFAIDNISQKVAVGGEQLSYLDLFNTESKEIFNPSKLKEKAIKMISLFSGGGILDFGFHKHGGYEIKFAIDRYEKKRLNRHHFDTYRHNIGDHIVEGDVLDLEKKDIPQADFVVGGIPCVKFSKLNTKDNFRDSLSDEFPLLEKFLTVVEWSGAKGFLIENVEEFALTKGAVLLNRIKERMSSFNIICKIIDATDLGSAQKRRRAFILGIKGVIPTLDVPKVRVVKTVRDAFKEAEKDPQYNLGFKLLGNYLERAKYIPQGGKLSSVPEELRPNRGFNNAIQRLHYDKVAPTITGVDSDYVLHPVLDRRITVGEIKSLFSLCNTGFTLCGSVTSMVTQLKNGVDYKVSTFLAKTIYEQMMPIL